MSSRALAVPALLAFVFAVVFGGCVEPPPPPAKFDRRFVMPRGPSERSLELNLGMNESDVIDYEWEILQDNSVIYFDIHTHGPDGDEYAEHGNYHDRKGTYRQPRNGSASLLFANDLPRVLDLHVRINGNFTVWSIYGP